MSYADAFSGGIIAPANLTYLSLVISADVTLAWPIEQTVSGPNVVAEIIDVSASVGGLNVNLPDARQVSKGYTALFNNVGAQTFSVRNNAAGVLVAPTSGTVWQLYLTDNSTAAGTWRVFQFGAGTSTANAAALVGAGLKAISTTLNLQLTTTATASSPVNLVDADRAKVIRWTGAVGILNLPAVGTVSADWFVAIRNDGTGNLTVTPAAGTIDGTTTKVFSNNSSGWVVSDGTNWYTLGFGSAAGGTGPTISTVVGSGTDYGFNVRSASLPGFSIRDTSRAANFQDFLVRASGGNLRIEPATAAGVGSPGILLEHGGAATPPTMSFQATDISFTTIGGGTTFGNLLVTGAGSFPNIQPTGVSGVEIDSKAFTINSQSGNYTLVIGDTGDLILHPNGAGAGDTFTIPANASVAFPVGTKVMFINRDANALSIAITTDTLILSGSTTTGTRTLAQNGVAKAIKIESTVWLIANLGGLT